ncbi:PREDICTED: izumo sperm-egg fusion protein 4 isoform X3 [Ceratotherium simum simum]|uniref:Izumo sperm-egg fusion protein 4 isoform X3 n=1 Tax=Ceratotherium simum simum TaxID=73337 RepID=A0ABM1DI83_CERSS|nr:PREDICTED: izumo sperm-egg fusion protein 4 isoform X3 [Ceratotherium simum simum]
MALLLCLGLTAALARGCLHCHSNFSEKFSFYRDHVNLKSWWVGDIPVSGSLLADWSQDTMKELHLAIPAEITRDKLDQVANAVYRKMDLLYQGKMYFPGYFPNELRAIFREQAASIVSVTVASPSTRPFPASTARTRMSSASVTTASRAPGGRLRAPLSVRSEALPRGAPSRPPPSLPSPGKGGVETLPAGPLNWGPRHLHAPCPRRSSAQWERAVQGLLHYM